MEKMNVYREKLEAQLREWKAKIEMLEEKAAKATAGMGMGSGLTFGYFPLTLLHGS